MAIDFLNSHADQPIATVLLAHGAMAPVDHPFFETLAGFLVNRGLNVARFEFAYMAERRTVATKRPPPRAEKLLSEYVTAVAQFRAEATSNLPLIIGGKSLGGRVASMVAPELFSDNMIAGLACFGYPFHPPNKPQNLRTAHLEVIDCPTLIVQGERDPFGTRSAIAGYQLDQRIRFHWVGDGDHDFKPRVKSGHTRDGNLEKVADALLTFAKDLKKK